LERNGEPLAFIWIEKQALFRIRRLAELDEYSVQHYLRVRCLGRCFRGGGNLGDILVLVPQLCQQRTRARVRMGIIAGEFVTESPQGY